MRRHTKELSLLWEAELNKAYYFVAYIISTVHSNTDPFSFKAIHGH